jgi:hypothetical protein
VVYGLHGFLWGLMGWGEEINFDVLGNLGRLSEFSDITISSIFSCSS